MMLERLTTYVAMDRRHGLVSQVSLPDRITGSALLADISGFTPLTEALVEHLGARRGAEELTRLLNTVYTALVSRVHHFEGSVICFIGDALIACFPEDDGMRALACGLQMQRAMKQFQALSAPHGGRVNLAMKAAVAAGPMRRFLVGDPNIRLIDVLAGKTVDRLSDAEHSANPGDVMASPEVARRMGSRIIIDEWRGRMGVVAGLRESAATSDWPDLDAETTLTPEVLKSYLLPPVYERVIAGQGEFLSELRPVAAIFLKFDGIDYDSDDAAGEKLNAYTSWVQAEVQRYGGHVLLLTTADKGSHLYAVFGALAAHEDDSQRAVAAAQALLRVPDELDYIVGTQIGVSYGRARVGAYGGETRQTYGALGDVVNLAARLMGIAPSGEIRCSQSVFERAKDQWEFEALESVQLKGMAQPQPVYCPAGRLAEGMAQSGNELVGRQAELNTLLFALEEANKGSRRIQLIEGEAGIGKSRLVDELIQKAVHLEFTYLFGAGDSIEQHTPYRAWRDILTTLFDLETGMSSDDRGNRVLKKVAELDVSGVDRAPLLNDVLALDLTENAMTKGLAPEVRQESLAAFIGEILQCTASVNPLLLVVDDAHWLDSLSWGLTISVARSLAHVPVLLIVTHRPFGDVEPAEFSILANLSHAGRLSLGALPPEATLKLAAFQLGLSPGALPEAVARLLNERSEGNPFYARELVNALIDTGQLTVEEGKCLVIGNSEDLLESVPSTLEGVVLSRLDLLPDDEQLTIKVASVIGRSFLILAVERTYPSSIERTELIRHLADTTHRRLTLMEFEDQESGYAFQHVVTQQVAYDTLLFEQRRILHKNVAEWIEETFNEELAPHFPLLVFHWGRAGRLDLELRYCRLAGEQASKKYANTEAVLYFSRALELLDQLGEPKDSDTRFDVLSNRVKVFAFLGKVEDERADLELLLTMAGDSENPQSRGSVLVKWADHHNRCGQFEQALDMGGEALEAMREAGSLEGEAQSLTMLGKTFEEQGEFPSAREHGERALQLFEKLVDIEGQAGSQKSLGIIHARLGELPQAMERFEAARELYRQLGDRKGEADILGNLGALNYYLGDYEATIKYTEQAQPMFDDMGNRSGSARCLSNLGNSHSAVGCFEQGLDCHERSLVLYQQLEDVNSCADSRSNMGNAYHALGVGGYPELSITMHDSNDSLRQAISCHAEALRLRRQIGAQSGEAVSLFSMGSVHLAIGDIKQAESYLNMADTISRELGLTRLSMRSVSALARARLMSGDIDSAIENSERVVEWLGDQELPDADEMRFAHFRVLSAAGREEDAQQYLKLATDSVLSQSEAIRDPDLRSQFLDMYHEILTSWKNRQAAP
jgi:adenylate cyclase